MGNKLLSKNFKTKGLSNVVTTMLLIMFVVALVAIVWVIVDNVIEEELESSGACADYGKVEINDFYTCYDSANDEMQISISVGDIEMDKLLVAVSGEGITLSFELTSTPGPVTGLRNYSDDGGIVFLPKKNSGLTYVYNIVDLGGVPKVVEVSPSVEGQQCSVSDTLYEFPPCSSLL